MSSSIILKTGLALTSGHDARLVNQRQIAEIFGVTRESIRKWADQGMPIHKGPQGRDAYLPAEVIRWREERAERKAIESVQGTDIDEAKRRKMAAEAALAELALAKARGEVVDLALVGGQLGSALAKCRAKLLALSAGIVPRLQIAADAKAMKRIVDDAVVQALEEISDGSLEFARGPDGADQDDDPGPDDGDDVAPAPANAKRVGRRQPPSQL